MTFHIVRMNEKIEKIALNYQLDVDEIKSVNSYIRDWDHLIPGTKLKLPEISNALNLELDNSEPFIEEYYPKLQNNYNFSENVVPVVKESKVEQNNNKEESINNKVVNQELVLPKSNSYYPYQNYYLGYPYPNYYYQRNYNKRKIR